MNKTDELLGSVHPRDGHPKIMAVIDGYLDESGIHAGAKVCVVAGYWGDRNHWKKFAQKWKSVLESFGVPYFHSREFWSPKLNAKSFYFGWTNGRRREFLAALVETIEKHKIHPVISAISVEDFFRYNERQRRFLTGAALKPSGKLSGTGSPNKPYFMPFFLCVDSIAGYAPKHGKAHFFCGLDRSFGKYAVELLRQAKIHPETRHREKMGDLTLPEASSTPHLQAADLLAYSGYQYGGDLLNDENVRPPKLLRKCLKRLKNRQEDNAWINRESIEGSFSEVLQRLS